LPISIKVGCTLCKGGNIIIIIIIINFIKKKKLGKGVCLSIMRDSFQLVFANRHNGILVPIIVHHMSENDLKLAHYTQRGFKFVHPLSPEGLHPEGKSSKSL